MKERTSAPNDAASRRRRALAVVAREKQHAIPASVDLVDFRSPSAAERAYGKSLKTRARALRKGAKDGRKIRKFAGAR